ncbi:uncharacterized protein TA17815 [Theileria annulata]|uniref:Srp40 C-terminal domain-containing protein n=1 Tax=Theileria annulata TaxID=5874 RepID=Q4UB82_THEAN|nr:uncharacterized protein TA17815 [Theileria annulata]CAI75919.1 hypothetical protein TA17815 [Theileria annulata]|eukprot:XP_955395.1 hypothetical protein TA17815 [Theileria annulata]
MTSDNLESSEPSPLLFSVVKILSDNGLRKTLKRLRKETKCKKLKEKHLPEEIKNADFNKMVSALFKKRKRSQNKTERKTKKPEESSKVLNGFVKSSKGLESTIEESKQSDSGNSQASDNSGPNQNESDAPTSGVPFRRIQDEVWLNRIEKEELKVNSYKMKNDAFGQKAAEELGSVKGKDFKSQKYKKKRSSWSGSGEITSSVNSFCFYTLTLPKQPIYPKNNSNMENV